MPLIELRVNVGQIKQLEVLFAKVGEQKFVAIRRALNWTGDRLYTRLKRTVAKQMGVKQRAFSKNVLKVPATRAAGRAVYRIVARQPAMSLKEFGARQTDAGVMASPWGRLQLFRGAFIVPSLGGHVFVRAGERRIMTKGIYAGKSRQPIRKLWGPVLANEIARGGAKLDHKAAMEQLPARIGHEIDAILRGYAPKGKA